MDLLQVIETDVVVSALMSGGAGGAIIAWLKKWIKKVNDMHELQMLSIRREISEVHGRCMLQGWISRWEFKTVCDQYALYKQYIDNTYVVSCMKDIDMLEIKDIGR